MTTKRALYAGSFDPITNGHIDIIERALKIFDEIVVVIAVSPTKKPLFSKEERISQLKAIFKNNPKVKIDTWDNLIVNYLKKNKIQFLIRGLRPTGDFESEFQMASMNKKLSPNIETVFFMTNENNYYVSSSLVKEIYQHGGDVKSFVPKEILKTLKKK